MYTIRKNTNLFQITANFIQKHSIKTDKILKNRLSQEQWQISSSQIRLDLFS